MSRSTSFLTLFYYHSALLCTTHALFSSPLHSRPCDNFYSAIVRTFYNTTTRTHNLIKYPHRLDPTHEKHIESWTSCNLLIVRNTCGDLSKLISGVAFNPENEVRGVDFHPLPCFTIRLGLCDYIFYLKNDYLFIW